MAPLCSRPQTIAALPEEALRGGGRQPRQQQAGELRPELELESRAHSRRLVVLGHATEQFAVPLDPGEGSLETNTVH
jgi:hypothetical protein